MPGCDTCRFEREVCPKGTGYGEEASKNRRHDEGAMTEDELEASMESLIGGASHG